MLIASKKANELLTEIWDGSIPVNPIKIANSLNINVYKSHEIDSLIECSVEDVEKSITIKPNESITSKIFYVAHSLGHLLLGHINDTLGTIKDQKYSFSSGAKSIEKEAKKFALTLLMPANHLKKQRFK